MTTGIVESLQFSRQLNFDVAAWEFSVGIVRELSFR